MSESAPARTAAAMSSAITCKKCGHPAKNHESVHSDIWDCGCLGPNDDNSEDCPCPRVREYVMWLADPDRPRCRDCGHMPYLHDERGCCTTVVDKWGMEDCCRCKAYVEKKTHEGRHCGACGRFVRRDGSCHRGCADGRRHL